jgi:hypothetical protein
MLVRVQHVLLQGCLGAKGATASPAVFVRCRILLVLLESLDGDEVPVTLLAVLHRGDTSWIN